MSFNNALTVLNAHPLLDTTIQKEAYIQLDLSIYNSDLEGVDVSSSKDLEIYIWKHMQKHNAKAAFGGYLERRGIYRRSDYFNQDDLETERNIHLGLDLWIEADTPILAPLEGTIHSFRNNTNYGDYGPTIILKHITENFEFYTLYGHLSDESLLDKDKGDVIKKGQIIATLGTANVNGDYPPHLHFQIIRDIQDYEGDYPGVCNQLDLEFYKHNCPDPQLLFSL